jgi:hypothetical protein
MLYGFFWVIPRRLNYITLHQCPYTFIPLPPTLRMGREQLHESPELQFCKATYAQSCLYLSGQTYGTTLLTVGEKVASAFC